MHGIARELGGDWRTAKKRYELQQNIENGNPLPLKQHSSILDPYKHIIDAKLGIAGITASAKVAQVDWKEDLTLISKYGELVTFNIFLVTLPFSEKKYCRLTLDKKQDTVITSLIYAFMYFNGVPKEIWFDNMLTIVDAVFDKLKVDQKITIL